MKIIFRSAIFHFLCIIIFAVLYTLIKDEYSVKHKPYTFLDFLALSTTIQCGVGFSDMFPTTSLGKLAVMFQQFVMLLAHIITAYFLTL